MDRFSASAKTTRRPTATHYLALEGYLALAYGQSGVSTVWTTHASPGIEVRGVGDVVILHPASPTWSRNDAAALLPWPHAEFLQLLHRLVGEFGLRPVAADNKHEDRVFPGFRSLDILKAPDCPGRK